MDPHATIPITLRALQRRIQHVVHERALARSADACHADHQPQRNLDVDVLEVVFEAQSTRIFWLVGFRRAAGPGSQLSEYSRSTIAAPASSRRRAREHDAPALLTRAEPHVDHYVSDLDHVRIVLDDEDGVP